MNNWTNRSSESLYHVPDWGGEFFSINEQGNLQVTPQGKNGPGIDTYELVGQLRRRGVDAPILLRFDGLLRARVRQLNAAFNHARREFDYTAPYRGVYPIKVNQERHVVEALLEEGRSYGMGLEVGSKPELIAGIALQAGEDALLICNGYKDQEYVEMALLASQLGITAIMVIEKFTELQTVLDASSKLGIRPVLGVRSKLSFKGSGRWQDSVGDRSKFGLSTGEVVAVVKELETQGMLDCLKLTHFHVGSQITQIRTLKQAMRESTRILAGLHAMGVEIHYFDVGGGLGIDYDGSHTDADSSRNYSLQEYANDVVWTLGEACREAGMRQPTIVSESGRGLAAHHAMLVGEVVGVTSLGSEHLPRVNKNSPEVLAELAGLTQGLTTSNYAERYHDAQDLREKAGTLFETGQISLEDRAAVEDGYWNVCRAVLKTTRSLEYVPEEFSHLEHELSDNYFVNISVFQSMPDAWAIGQLFPVLPLHRHQERPTRRGTIADLTCDSDGKITSFIDRHGPRDTLDLHELHEGEPYYLGFCLVGAYQEILGDMHNLFGDTNTVHVDLDDKGRVRLAHVLRGDRVKEVLSYVEYFEDDLLRSLRRHVENALDAGSMSYEESAMFWSRYERGLHGYTYLTRPQADGTALRPLNLDTAAQ